MEPSRVDFLVSNYVFEGHGIIIATTMFLFVLLVMQAYFILSTSEVKLFTIFVKIPKLKDFLNYYSFTTFWSFHHPLLFFGGLKWACFNESNSPPIALCMVRKCHRISNRGIPSPWGREARTGEKGIKSHPPHTMSMRATTNNSNQSMHLAMTTSRTITIRFAHFCKEHWTNCDLNFRLFRIGVWRPYMYRVL